MKHSVLALALAALTGCASLASAIRRPTAEVVGVEIESLSFEQATLRIDIKVTNPNPVGVELAGFDYRLLVEGTEFLTGTVDRKVSLKASGSSVIPVPVSFGYEKLLSAVKALADKDESAYEVTVGLTFELPVLDKVKVTVARKGMLPVVRLPGVRVASLRLERMTLQGASLSLGLEVSNPNGFGLSLGSLDYRFAVAGRDWATGTARRATQVASRGSARIDIPIDLDFGSIGRSVAETLGGRAPLSYALSAKLSVGTTLPLLKSATVPVELSGQIAVQR